MLSSLALCAECLTFESRPGEWLPESDFDGCPQALYAISRVVPQPRPGMSSKSRIFFGPVVPEVLIRSPDIDLSLSRSEREGLCHAVSFYSYSCSCRFPLLRDASLVFVTV
jgi:hypothetical protein